MIKVDNLTFRYTKSRPSSEGLDQISFTIQEGERVAIIGPSGSGKSTLLKCINGLLIPQIGRVYLDGTTAMIFQDYSLIQRSLTIENVLLGRLSYLPFYRKYLAGFAFSRTDYKIALKNLKRVDLFDYAFRRVDNMSGGQQQRVGIARALTQETKVILADEPVSNLDPNRKSEILNLLVSICYNFNLTLLISMHEINLAKQYVERIIGINNGCLVFDGPVNNFTEKTYETIYA